MNNKKFWVNISAILSTTLASSKSPAIDLQSKPKNSDKTDFNTISSPFKSKPGKHSLIGEVSNTEYPLVLSNNGRVTPLIKGLQAFELSYLYGLTDSLQLGILIPGERPTGVVGSYDEGKSYLTNILIEPKIYFADNIALIPLYYLPSSGQSVQTVIGGNSVTVPTTNQKESYGAKISVGFGEKGVDDTLVAVQVGAIIAPESKFREIDQSLRYQFGAGVNHKLSGNLKLLVEAYGEKTSTNAPLEALAMIEYSNDNYMLRIGGGSGDLKGSGSNTSRVLANFAYYFGEESVSAPKKYNLDGDANPEKVDQIRKRMQENQKRGYDNKFNEENGTQEESPIEDQSNPEFDTESRSKLYPGELVCDSNDFSKTYSRAIASVTDAGAIGEGSIENPEIKEILIASTDKALVRKVKYYSKNINVAINKLNENLVKLEKAKNKKNAELVDKIQVEINWGIRVFYKNKYELDKYISYAEKDIKKSIVETEQLYAPVIQKAQVATNFEPKIQDVDFSKGTQFKVDVKTSLLMRSSPKIDSKNIVGRLLVDDIVEAISNSITNGYVQINIIESAQKNKVNTPVYVHGNFLKKIDVQVELKKIAEVKDPKVDVEKTQALNIPLKNQEILEQQPLVLKSEVDFAEKGQEIPEEFKVIEKVEDHPAQDPVVIAKQIFQNEILKSKDFLDKDVTTEEISIVKEVSIPKDLTPVFANALIEITDQETVIELAKAQKANLVVNNKIILETKEGEIPDTVKVSITEDPKKDLTPAFASAIKSDDASASVIEDAKKATGQSSNLIYSIDTKSVENKLETVHVHIDNPVEIKHVELERLPQDQVEISKQIFQNEIVKSKNFMDADVTSESFVVEKERDPQEESVIAKQIFKNELVKSKTFIDQDVTSEQILTTKALEDIPKVVEIKKNLTPTFAQSVSEDIGFNDVLKTAKESKGLSVADTSKNTVVEVYEPLETVKIEIKEEPKKDLTPAFASSFDSKESSNDDVLATAKAHSGKESSKIADSSLKTISLNESLETIKVEFKEETQKDLTPAFASSVGKDDGSASVIQAAKDAKGSFETNTPKINTVTFNEPLETVKVVIEEFTPVQKSNSPEMLQSTIAKEEDKKIIVQDLKQKPKEVIKDNLIEIPNIGEQQVQSKFGKDFIFDKEEKQYIVWDKNAVIEDPKNVVENELIKQGETSEVRVVTSPNEEKPVFRMENNDDPRSLADTKIPKTLPAKSVDKESVDMRKKNEISEHLAKEKLNEKVEITEKIVIPSPVINAEKNVDSDIVIEIVSKDLPIVEAKKVPVEAPVTKDVIQVENSREVKVEAPVIVVAPVEAKIIVVKESPKEEPVKESTLVIIDNSQKTEKKESIAPVVEIKNTTPVKNVELKPEEVVEIKSLEANSLTQAMENKPAVDSSIEEAEARKARIQEEIKSIDAYIDQKLNKTTESSPVPTEVIEKKSSEEKVKNENSEDIFLRNLKNKERQEQDRKINMPLQEQDGIEEQNGPSFGGISE